VVTNPPVSGGRASEDVIALSGAKEGETGQSTLFELPQEATRLAAYMDCTGFSWPLLSGIGQRNQPAKRDEEYLHAAVESAVPSWIVRWWRPTIVRFSSVKTLEATNARYHW